MSLLHDTPRGQGHCGGMAGWTPVMQLGVKGSQEGSGLGRWERSVWGGGE